jgi:hypothetical protein
MHMHIVTFFLLRNLHNQLEVTLPSCMQVVDVDTAADGMLHRVYQPETAVLTHKTLIQLCVACMRRQILVSPKLIL